MSNSHPAQQLPRFTKQGPKRLRRTRRDFGEGQYSQWANCTTHFKREREARLERIRMADES